MLSFTLLGHVVLSKNSEPLRQFRSQKEMALLIYLAQTGQAHSRDAVADLLWNASSTQQALSNLRTALTRLRKQVGDALVITRKSLALTAESQQQVDSVVLLQRLAQLEHVNSAEEANALQQTLDAYRGDFLADFLLPSAPRFEEWAAATRTQIRREATAGYAKLARYTQSTGDAERGIAIARRWLDVDALDEAAHMQLIELLLQDGQVRQAVAHYANCAQLLRAELDVGPPTAMTALIQEAQLAFTVPQLMAKLDAAQHPASHIHHNLPTPHDQFFGRAAVQREIHARLDQPWCRLVTLTGQGGVGKTRLATTVARSRVDRYRDGVWLVELADVDPNDVDAPEAIAVEIATALDLRLSGPEKPLAQLLSFLQHKELLLVLDNVEHVIEGGAQIVLDLLQRCESVQMLATSREALRIKAEWAVALTGLGYPRDDAGETPFDAVELFLARRAQRRLEALSADERAAIDQICRAVEGLPLAIELAAALTHGRSCRAVADGLRDGFGALATALRDVPDRHRSLAIVFEMSWRTLTPALQRRLARLSIFRGGFTAEAAQRIANVDVQQLGALLDKSLLVRDEQSGRYALHAVVRACAAEKLVEHEHASSQSEQNHARYYLTLLVEQTEALQKDAPQHAVAVIQPDIGNVRLAWQTGLARCSVDLLSAALTSLSIYHQLRGLAHEAEGIMRTTLYTAIEWGVDGIALATHAGLERARFQIRLGRYRPAVETAETALRDAGHCGERWAEGMAHVLWGEALWRQSDYDLAQNRLAHARDIADALADDDPTGSTRLLGWVHHHLGVIHDIQGRYEAAHEHLARACAAWRSIENVQGLSGSLNSVGLVCSHRGDLSAAKRAMEEALTLCGQLNDRHRQSSLLNNLGMLSTNQGDYLSAHYHLRLGLDLATASDNSTAQGEILNNLARNYLQLDKITLAIDSLEQGLQISESIGNYPLIAEAMIQLAAIKRKQGDLFQAEYWFEQALTIARQNNIRRTEYDALINMAELLSKKDEKQARQYSEEAVTLAKAIQNSDFLERAEALNRFLRVPVDASANTPI